MRFRSRDIAMISKLMNASNTALPDVFNKNLGKLESIGYWKATQYRTCLLHVGPVVQRGKHFDTAVYENFCFTLWMLSFTK